jgi:hypothetical protein
LELTIEFILTRLNTERRKKTEKQRVKWIRKEMEGYENRKNKRIKFYIKTMRWKEGLKEVSK